MSVLFRASGQFTADGFVEFLDHLHEVIWRPSPCEEGATALNVGSESRMEFGPGVEFRETYLFIERAQDRKAIGLEFLAGNCKARIPLSDIRDVSVEVVLEETNRYGGTNLSLGLCIVRTDGWRFQGTIVYRLRARRSVRHAIASALSTILAPATEAAC